MPPNPGGWLTTTAGNRPIDRLRRGKQRDAKHQAAGLVPPLRLIFTCCHPALAA